MNTACAIRPASLVWSALPARAASRNKSVAPRAIARGAHPGPGFAPFPDDTALAGRTVRVVGLGDSGLAMARWLNAQGARVLACDTRADPPQRSRLAALCPQVQFVGGALDASLLDGVDLLAWSPGLSPYLGAAAGLAQAARERAIPVVGEIELFCRALAAHPESGQVLAITGTNGKTTTACLLAHLLRAADLRVELAGNVGPVALDVLRECIERNAFPQYWVLELSSFQLEFAPSLRPAVAAFLNLSEDHLDWHGSMLAYQGAKQRIFTQAQVRVWNRDDAASEPVGGTPRQRKAPARPAPDISFGLDRPQRVGDLGVIHDGGLAWLVEGIAGSSSRGRRRPLAGAEPETLRSNLLMPAQALRIRGRHNHANALAALAVARAAGAPLARLLHALRDYSGEPHRCESIAVIAEVEYIDDSKGTNVGATVAALNGLGDRERRRLILIAGGDGKGQDFTPLAAPVQRAVRVVLLIGRDAPRLRAALGATGVELVDCASLEQAVDQAGARSRPGDQVLLSPACASLDMFRNYVHRSQVFADAVHELAQRQGQLC